MDTTKDVKELNIDELLEELSKPVNIQINESENIYTKIINFIDNIELEETYENSNDFETFDIENIEIIDDEFEEISLIPIKNTFLVSSRQLSQFYLFKKKVKIALYKLFVKLPKMVFGLE